MYHCAFGRSLGLNQAGFRRVALLTGVAASLLGCTSASYAWLGGFESADGYKPFLNQVQNYNAGQYGANSGYMAMSPVAIPANTGLWVALQGGVGLSYATGHQNTDRTYVNSNATLGLSSDQGLVITTGASGFSGPATKYRYNVDTQDLGGVAPASTGGQTVKLSFWARGMVDAQDTSGAQIEGYLGNTVDFQDSSGNVGFRLGLTNRISGDKITYWNGSSMFESAIFASPNYYDRWDITLDLASQTVTAAYFSFPTSTSYTLITGAAMMQTMSNFSMMTFETSPGTTNNKLSSYDDFSFRATPAPGAVGLLGLGGLAAMRRRRTA